jgi:predicted nuclease with RNAse H fold
LSNILPTLPSNGAFWGIDFGSKSAGTTVVASLEDGTISLHRSEKKSDADAFLSSLVQSVRPSTVGIDVPLSLPGVYRGIANTEDYFYRQGDKLLHAMSPMFLGGLTARAMRFAAELRAKGIAVVEVYPAALVKYISLPADHYKKDLSAFMDAVEISCLSLGLSKLPIVADWHECDAILALMSTVRLTSGFATQVGDKLEGQIVI